MNITQLRYFHAVAAYHTVSLAAQHLYISQPSLSNAIKELEKEFSVILFYRRYNGMFLTPEGTKLFNSTKELLLKYDEVERMMHSLGKDARQLRLGIPPMIGSFVFADIYKGFVLENDDIELSITEKGRYELLDRLNDGLLDLVLLPHTKLPDTGISAKRIGRLEVVCCVSREHPLAEYNTLTPELLDGEPLVLFSDSFFQTTMIKRWFADAGIEPSVAIQTEQLSTAQNMIENGLAAGFVFRKIAERSDSLCAISLSPSIYVDVSVIRRKDSYVSDGVRKLERYLEKGNPFGE